ncbi:MAG: ATP-dependent RecD-like DNA helicase [Chloroflexota bacterium]|nr:ATP-dependent RecD-like DNA helicase [Chloroflexota bacterium]
MQETLKGSVERITYVNEENGYSVIRLAVPGRRELVTAVGELASVNVGESLRLNGFWTTHPQYGRQFKALDYKTTLPATLEGIRRYLGSGLIKGVGPVTARRIVDHFGLETLEVIEREPERLQEVPGVGPKRSSMIIRAWEEQQEIKELMLFLQSHEVSATLAVKIYRTYGDEALTIVRENPYRLAHDIYGIGFLTADKIARKLGMDTDAPQRVQAGISYVLSQLADEGHVYAPHGKLIAESVEILDVPAEMVAEGIEALTARGELHRENLTRPDDSDITYPLLEERNAGEIAQEEQAIYLPPFYYSEIGVANQLRRMLLSTRGSLTEFQAADWDRLWARIESTSTLQLNEGQRRVVRTALTHKVTVLTGGPGTGKTTVVQTIIRLLEGYGRSYALAAPTGRAAKRLSEATGRPAKTIHRLLEFSPTAGHTFQRNEAHPLEAEMVIVDETSMLDLLLANNLLKAIPPTSHLLLVGDVDQLPSVGAGNVLRDIIESGVAAVVQLEEIFRQEEGSWIVRNAHRINRGQMPIFAQGARDFFLFVKDEPEEAAELLIDIVQNRIPRKFGPPATGGYDPVEDIQVLSPMYRGPVGVTNLNTRLQEALNPPHPGKPERSFGGQVFRLGDKVMQIRNNYDKDVFNGDIGRVVGIDPLNQLLTVQIDERPVAYDFSELDELMHAYAISIHKSQGSEYPAVVVPLMMTHYIMLQRNLLYTAVTRARELVVIVGTRRAIAIAVHNDKIAERHTALDVRLRENATRD